MEKEDLYRHLAAYYQEGRRANKDPRRILDEIQEQLRMVEGMADFVGKFMAWVRRTPFELMGQEDFRKVIDFRNTADAWLTVNDQAALALVLPRITDATATLDRIREQITTDLSYLVEKLARAYRGSQVLATGAVTVKSDLFKAFRRDCLLPILSPFTAYQDRQGFNIFQQVKGDLFAGYDFAPALRQGLDQALADFSEREGPMVERERAFYNFLAALGSPGVELWDRIPERLDDYDRRFKEAQDRDAINARRHDLGVAVVDFQNPDDLKAFLEAQGKGDQGDK